MTLHCILRSSRSRQCKHASVSNQTPKGWLSYSAPENNALYVGFDLVTVFVNNIPLEPDFISFDLIFRASHADKLGSGRSTDLSV